MLLLQEMKTKIRPSFEMKLDPRDVPIHKEAKKEFSGMLNGSLEGKELVREIYALLDKLISKFLETNQIICHQGCYSCCRQLILCTTLEMELIVEYLRSLSRERRRKITLRVKKEAKWFRRFMQQIQTNSLLEPQQRWEITSQPLMAAYHGERACPFLSPKGSCSIYPVRPIDCRIARTNDKGCGMEESGLIKKPEEIRLFVDQVASDLIMEEEGKTYGKSQVAPLAYWPMTEKFSEFFLGVQPQNKSINRRTGGHINRR